MKPASIVATAGVSLLIALSASPSQAHQPPPVDYPIVDTTKLGQECFAINTGAHARGAAVEQNSICVAPDEITLVSAGQQVASFKVKQRSVDNCKDCHRATYQVVGTAFSKITIAFNGRIDPKTAIERGTVRIGNVSYRYSSGGEAPYNQPVMPARVDCHPGVPCDKLVR
jgi:cytochrome c551/c552